LAAQCVAQFDMETYVVTRRIEIDAAHRVMNHASQCRHIHGHRYVVEASCQARELRSVGSEAGMVLDFGFLKCEMMSEIHAPCDHGFIVTLFDEELLRMLCPEGAPWEEWLHFVSEEVRANGYCATSRARLGTKLYILPFQTTAECLARHWYERLKAKLAADRDVAGVKLRSVKVWETPNCSATYGPDDG
jgi:6-pyruvoyltetrahydropterin/6-carboxytetrahydropterin synthase